MTRAFRSDGILYTTAMPDGPRRSARIADLTKKRRSKEVTTTEPHSRLGRHTAKEKTGLLKPSGSSQGPLPKQPGTEISKTRGRRALERLRDKPQVVEHEPLSRKQRGRQQAERETGRRQARASDRLFAKHLIQQPVKSTWTRALEAEVQSQQENTRATLNRDALRRLETQTAKHPLPEALSTVMIRTRSS